MLWALHIYEIIDALCNVCTKCPWNGSTTTDIESVFPSVWHSTSNLSIFINASSMMNNTRHLRIKTSYKITNVVQRCCSFCKVRQKNYQFSSKILGCRDPRCKHEYLDSSWFDKKSIHFEEMSPEDDGDESDKHI